MANETHVIYLLDRVLNDQANEAELLELAEMLRSDETGLISTELSAHLENQRGGGAFPDRDWDAVTTRILQADKMPARVFHIGRRVAAAAIVLLLAGSTYLFLMRHSRPAPAEPSSAEKGSTPEILPGGNKAILTLFDGKKIILDSAQNGQLAMQGNAQVSKTDSGKLIYRSMGAASGTQLVYNTLTTPRGGQYQLVLPDGSRVWLNAASGITYPTAFTGSERKVTITGEAYLEIAQNARQPFIVRVGDMGIRVLGTSFNVNAYPDETSIYSTLLDGKLQVTQKEKTLTLLPGQQAQVKQTGDHIILNLHPDIEQAVAWKNGLFNFNQADLQSVMRQLGRWYDVDIVYEREIPKLRFLGEMQRELNLSDVLDVLKRTDVHFRIDGRKIIVLP